MAGGLRPQWLFADLRCRFNVSIPFCKDRLNNAQDTSPSFRPDEACQPMSKATNRITHLILNWYIPEYLVFPASPCTDPPKTNKESLSGSRTI